MSKKAESVKPAKQVADNALEAIRRHLLPLAEQPERVLRDRLRLAETQVFEIRRELERRRPAK